MRFFQYYFSSLDCGTLLFLCCVLLLVGIRYASWHYHYWQVCSLSFLGLLDTFPLHLKLFPVCLAVETAFLTSVYFWSKVEYTIAIVCCVWCRAGLHVCGHVRGLHVLWCGDVCGCGLSMHHVCVVCIDACA